MTPRKPSFPVRPPRPMDDLTVFVATVKQEAGGEPWLGQLGVAWVIRNRAERRNQSVIDVVFRSKQFSAWEGDSPTRTNLDSTDVDEWFMAGAAACAAYFGLVADPTNGADHYLNVERVLSTTGKLPLWAADPADASRRTLWAEKVTAAVGGHTFLRLW